MLLHRPYFFDRLTAIIALCAMIAVWLLKQPSRIAYTYFSPNSDLQRAVGKAARCEQRLSERLSEPEKTILTELVRAQHDIDSITACENFIIGFRLGIKMMAECMDENDGDIQEIDEHA